MFQGGRALEHKHSAAVFGGGEANGGLPECNRPLDERKIRGDPKSSAQRPLLTRVEDALEVRQERVDVDVGQLLRRVGLIRRFKQVVGKSGFQLQDQFIHFRWCPRGARLPQAADHRSALVPVQNRFDHVGPKGVTDLGLQCWSM